MSKETMMCYSNNDLLILMFLYSSDMRLGAHVSHIKDANVIFANVEEALKHDHVSDYQTNYAVTDKDILSVVYALEKNFYILTKNIFVPIRTINT